MVVVPTDFCPVSTYSINIHWVLAVLWQSKFSRFKNHVVCSFFCPWSVRKTNLILRCHAGEGFITTLSLQNSNSKKGRKPKLSLRFLDSVSCSIFKPNTSCIGKKNELPQPKLTVLLPPERRVRFFASTGAAWFYNVLILQVRHVMVDAGKTLRQALRVHSNWHHIMPSSCRLLVPEAMRGHTMS